MLLSRRSLLQGMAATGILGIMGPRRTFAEPPRGGTDRYGEPVIYRTVGGSVRDRLAKLLDLQGGVENLIGEQDVVLIKPNLQWWNQGAADLEAVDALVGIIIARPGGFRGEVVVMENCHRGSRPWETKASGWAGEFLRNGAEGGKGNMNSLAETLKHRYGDRFSVCHLIDIDAGGKRVSGPAEGTGYVWCDGTLGVPLLSYDNQLAGPGRRATLMTYPILVTDRGTVVDLKHGIWSKGSYTGQPLKLWNLAGLNHHSTYCGVTSSIKNYLGLVDLSGGPDPHQGGRLTGDYCNFHSFPYDKWARGPAPGMLGAEVAAFMGAIRRADLNIITSEWVGVSSRTGTPVARARALLAGTDPVALDYHAAKYILFPNSRISLHDPDLPGNPFRAELLGCAGGGGGLLDETRTKVVSWDMADGRFQSAGDSTVKGEMTWGEDVKGLLKYACLRWIA